MEQPHTREIFINRELSWLEFNRRVLDLAKDKTVPVGEQLKFAAIYASNLDEFFMVRVGSLYDRTLVGGDEKENKTGMTPAQQLDAIMPKVAELQQHCDKIVAKLYENVGVLGYRRVDFAHLSKEAEHFWRKYFMQEIFPVLSPQIIDRRHPFPFLRNNEVYVGTILKGKGDAQSSFGLVPISTQFQRIIFVPSGGSVAFALVEEMVEVYYNSNQFGKTLRAIEKLFDNPFALYEALGAFYDKKGYMDISHTRIRRYEILQEFLQEYVDEEQMDYYRQLMICDLYARENMKTRPAWAKDLKAYKRDIREFYLKEEETHEYLPEYEGYDEKQLARMTHLERMDYDPDTGVREPCWILFDYRSRDVLTYDAKMVKLSLVDIMQK